MARTQLWGEREEAVLVKHRGPSIGLYVVVLFFDASDGREHVQRGDQVAEGVSDDILG